MTFISKTPRPPYYAVIFTSINADVDHTEHRIATKKGREIWYSHYFIRICKVERDYGRADA
jgi:heme-degrading monooxygenase HmoA